MKLVRGKGLNKQGLISEIEVIDVNLNQAEITKLARTDKCFIRVYPDDSPVYTEVVVGKVINSINSKLYKTSMSKLDIQTLFLETLVDVRNNRSPKRTKNKKRN